MVFLRGGGTLMPLAKTIVTPQEDLDTPTGFKKARPRKVLWPGV